MLLNISNHPSVIWLENQKKQALDAFGDIEDMPFPHISPAATSAEVLAFAKEYQQKIANKYKPQTTVVHLMGELTFTFALVKLLQMAGFKVVCSTTERLVVQENAEVKTARFKFHIFREYPHLMDNG